MSNKNNYGNWLPQKTLFLFFYVSVLLFIPTLLFDYAVVKWILYSASALFLVFFLYLEYTYFLLGKDGGNLQQQFYQLVIDKLPWHGDGRALDIGTGNGAIAIELAKKFLKNQKNKAFYNKLIKCSIGRVPSTRD